MEDDLKKMKIEDNLIFFKTRMKTYQKMEDDLKKIKMEDDLKQLNQAELSISCAEFSFLLLLLCTIVLHILLQ